MAKWRTVTVRADDLADVLDRVLSLPVAEHPHWQRTARLAAALREVGEPLTERADALRDHDDPSDVSGRHSAGGET